MTNRYDGQVGLRYEEIIVGRVTGVYPVVADLTNPGDMRPRVDVFALDGRGVYAKVPTAFPAGHIRNWRKGQHVMLGFRHGMSSAPVIIGHLFNLENDPDFTDPIPPSYENVGDDVWYHPETGAFFRFRNALSTPLGALETAGQPCVAELTLASGATMKFSELPGGLCSYTVLMPTGASIYIDDIGNIEVESPATVTVQAAGNVAVIAGVNASVTAATQVTVTAPKVVVNSVNVELGADASQSAANGVTRQEDSVSNFTRFKAAMVTASVPNAGSITIPTMSASTQVFSE